MKMGGLGLGCAKKCCTARSYTSHPWNQPWMRDAHRAAMTCNWPLWLPPRLGAGAELAIGLGHLVSTPCATQERSRRRSARATRRRRDRGLFRSWALLTCMLHYPADANRLETRVQSRGTCHNALLAAFIYILSPLPISEFLCAFLPVAVAATMLHLPRERREKTSQRTWCEVGQPCASREMGEHHQTQLLLRAAIARGCAHAAATASRRTAT